ncbi:MAG: DUF2066 domain-containing protein [Chromatiales bacterium]
MSAKSPNTAFECAAGLRWRVVLALLAFTAGVAGAATVTGLNEALVPVADRTDKARAEATKEALREVLIKLTGDRNAIRGETEALIRDAGNYVLQYQYRDLPAQEDGGRPRTALWVQFDEAALTNALAATGVAPWGSDRPSLLLWLLSEQGDSGSLTGSEEQSALGESARFHASRRGIPLVLPLLDLDDTARIAPSDVKRDNVERIRDASARYATRATATAVLTDAPEGGWRGRFTLQFGERSSTWLAQGETPDAALGQGMDQFADALAAGAVTARPAGSRESVKLQVEGIETAQQFAQVEEYLRTLSPVESVAVQRLERGRVTFGVVSRGGLPTLRDTVARGGVLQAVGDGAEARFRLLH